MKTSGLIRGGLWARWPLCLLVLAWVFLVGCSEETRFDAGQVELYVQPVDTAGRSDLRVDSLWVHVADWQGRLIDSAVSRHGSAVRFFLPVGSYDLRAFGRLRGSQRVELYAGSLAGQQVEARGLRVNLPVLVSETLPAGCVAPSGYTVLTLGIRWPYEQLERPIAGIEVTVRNVTDGTEYTGLTDEHGEWRVALPQGEYRARARTLVRTGVEGTMQVYLCELEGLSVRGLELRSEGVLKPSLTQLAQQCTVAVRIKMPQEVEGTRLSGHRVVLERLTCDERYEQLSDAEGVAYFDVPQGLYRAWVRTRANDKSGLWNYTLYGEKGNIVLAEKENATELECGAQSRLSNLLIKEIYFSASTSIATGERYEVDKYMELYNNCGDTLYVDGVSMCATYANTMVPKGMNFFPQYIGTEYVVPGLIFAVPGSGREHPLAPGHTLLLADQGLNHHALEPGSPVDMSGADFEWYDYHRGDVDVPEVPNLEKWFTYSLTITTLHVRGYWGFYIMKGEGDMQSFLNRYLKDAIYPNGSSTKIYAIPKRFILDAVMCADPKGPKTRVFTEDQDAGYTYCTQIFSGKCVQRKVAGQVNGRYILQDTNNSTNDFRPDATPSPRVVVP